MLDATDGFIPLWREGTTLRWRFNEAALAVFQNPAAVRTYVRGLMSEAVIAWGDSAPVRFTERSDAWDFEVVIRSANRCSPGGCMLASAFLPDGGRHELVVYPKMFEQVRKEQVDTMIHELGHVFGLRHFFADVRETRWASEIFGTHRPFSIMNYGHISELTDDDKGDLKRLYELVWSGQLTNVNETPIRLMTAYHDSGAVISRCHGSAIAAG